MNENLIRCFIAVSLPAEILNQINNYIQKLRQIAPDVRWVKAHGIHITLKFLAEQPQPVVTRIQENLHDITGVVNPFRLKVNGTGCFPNARRPKVFWLGLDHDPDNSLFKLHDFIENNLEPLGFLREKRRFSPHLTMGRVKLPADYQHIFSYFESSPFPVMQFNVNEVVLMRSVLRPQGAVYTPIETYELHKN
jgi:2'-5' RNA ligase